MAEQQTSEPTRAAHPPSGSSRGAWKIILVVVGIFVLYQATMWLVRRYVDQQIESNVGEQVVSFSLQDLDGRTWTAEELRGKQVVLNFFRSYCQMCAIEAPHVREFVRRVDPEKVVVLGIMVDQVEGFPPDVTQRTLVEFGFQHPVLMADESFVDHFHGAGWANVTPVTYIIDAKGRIKQSLRGHQSLDALLQAIV